MQIRLRDCKGIPKQRGQRHTVKCAGCGELLDDGKYSALEIIDQWPSKPYTVVRLCGNYTCLINYLQSEYK